jgi:hypothetical protein
MELLQGELHFLACRLELLPGILVCHRLAT